MDHNHLSRLDNYHFPLKYYISISFPINSYSAAKLVQTSFNFEALRTEYNRIKYMNAFFNTIVLDEFHDHDAYLHKLHTK